nr:unnamed protein product [Spirometra erinaceieuropaei]
MNFLRPFAKTAVGKNDGDAYTPKNKIQPITAGHVSFLYGAVILIVAPLHWIFPSDLINLRIRIIHQLAWNVLPEGYWAECRRTTQAIGKKWIRKPSSWCVRDIPLRYLSNDLGHLYG